MPVVGTAGHVDHGKSTLVERLTGRDPDRWVEEKKRGLTIDLGFAWATLPGGDEVSFVDVPGHERFLKNMLAGVEAIDVALFVVAADEGWMPQSEEHLAVLDLLEVSRGVIAITKVDSVDADMVELASAEVEDRVAGTTLARAPIVGVSALSGSGITELLNALEGQIDFDAPSLGRPRLWIDRSFPVSGAGTVVTGTLLDGELCVEDEIEIYPQGLRARVRGIQSHETTLNRVDPGRRVAINLGGVDHDQVARGDMVGLTGQWHQSDRFAGSIRTARFVEEIDQRGAYQIHIGSGAHQVAVTGLREDVAVLSLHTAVPMRVGDRFIIRDTGRQLVVAGGRVLDPAPPRTSRALGESLNIDPSGDPDAIATGLLAIRHRSSVTDLAAESGGGAPVDALVVADTALTFAEADRLTQRAIALVHAEHQSHPLRPGLSLATITERLGIDGPIAEAIIDRTDQLRRLGPDVASVNHTSQLTDAQQNRWEQARRKLAADLAVPSEGELGLDAELVTLKIREGELVRVGPGLVYLPDQLVEIEERLKSLGDGFTVADFRDAVGLSRKYAVPILEWADKEGLTVRRGDVRYLR